jgi:hypothetical protein
MIARPWIASRDLIRVGAGVRLWGVSPRGIVADDRAWSATNDT